MKRKNLIMITLCMTVAVSVAMSGCKRQREDMAKKEAAKLQAEMAKKSERVQKPSAEEALQLLREGNERFAAGKAINPRSDAARVALANKEDQGDHAYATIISCSDSRVPVERIFDAGIMDIFVVRVAGNVCGTDECGSIEYGTEHVKTPVLVVLGHSKCGAVKAVTYKLQGKGHELTRNITALVAPIIPAVKRAMKNEPDKKDDEIIPFAVEENVWQGIEDLFTKSPTVRELVNEKKLVVVGAIYDLASGRVNWLPEARVEAILKKVETSPKRVREAPKRTVRAHH